MEAKLRPDQRRRLAHLQHEGTILELGHQVWIAEHLGRKLSVEDVPLLGISPRRYREVAGGSARA